MFEYDYYGNEAATLAVSQKYIVADTQTCIVMYNRSQDAVVWEHRVAVRGMLFISDSNILVTTERGLVRYRLGSKGLRTLIWEFELAEAGSIAITSSRLIIVRCCAAPQVYLVSTKG